MNEHTKSLKNLQLKMLRIQQGVWHHKDRVVIVFEGFDASGKGGTIRKITEKLDPRGVRVHPIGPPSIEEQSKHYLYRFWKDLPAPGTIAIFDRSWYGRVLVEKVDQLISPQRVKDAYIEINQFEEMLHRDGIIIIKIFLQISKDEQLKRFEERLNDPYKQWKLTWDDIKARKKWNLYEKASVEIFKKTNSRYSPWHVIKSDDKDLVRIEALKLIGRRLKLQEIWMEKEASKLGSRKLSKVLHEMKIKKV